MHWRKGLVRVFSLVLSLCVALAALELGLRVFWIKRLTVSAGIEDPHFHHRYSPGSVNSFEGREFQGSIQNNRLGLRGPAPVLPKPYGRIRILMLGDSFTYGFPVKDEETFCRLIERDLVERGYPVEVTNGGVSGYSPTLHYISLRDEFIEFDPDIVVLWYDLGDLQEDHRYQKNLIYDDDGRIERCDPRYTNGRFDRAEWLRNHLAIAKYFDAKIARTVQKARTLGLKNYIQTKLRGGRAKVAIARLKSEQGAEDLAQHDRFLFVRESTTEASVRPYWELSARYLVMIRDLLAERDIPLILGVYPYGMLAGPEQWNEGRVAWGFEAGRTYSARTAVSIFEEFSRSYDIPLVNTFESFRAAAERQKLFFDWDGHFTPAGHRVLAEHFANDDGFLRVLHARKFPFSMVE